MSKRLEDFDLQDPNFNYEDPEYLEAITVTIPKGLTVHYKGIPIDLMKDATGYSLMIAKMGLGKIDELRATN